MIDKGAKLVGAVGALAPTDFVVSKSGTYYKFLVLRSQSLQKSPKVLKSLVLHPHFLGPIGALDDSFLLYLI